MKRIFIVFLGLVSVLAAQARCIPADPDFRVGKLENGLTYYLYHNENPSGVAEFYIAHHVGALQEEDNQNGLAHFLEHMAFNGTKHYPDKELLNFLAKDGVRFGYNVNAYTSRTETVYNISAVPLVRESFVDSVLMILHDWSCDISCEQDALDAERGVISEEWRLRDEPRYRMMCRQNDLIYKGSKHPFRTVIGSMDVINNFKREEILDFYHKWYRPDMQAILIVGDFDVDAMEVKVKSMFADIPSQENPARKEIYKPAPLTEPMFADQTDGAIKYQAVKLMFKQPFPEESMRSTEDFYRDQYCRQIVSSVLSDRLKQVAKSPSCPMRSAVLVTSAYEPDFYLSLFTLSPRSKDNMLDALTIAYREIRRMLEFGISEAEFEAAKLSFAQRSKLDSEEARENVTNEALVKTALRSFLLGYPLVTPTDLRQIQRKCLDDITYSDVARYPGDMFRDSEVIYSNCYNNVENPSIAPSADRMKAAIASVDAEMLTPSFLEYPELDLEIPAVPGSILSESRVRDTGIEEWKLSNGARVYFKQSAPVSSGDHLSMSYVFDTGYRAFDNRSIKASRFAASYIRRFAGVRGCEGTEFRNYPELAGISSLIYCGGRFSRLDLNSTRDKAENAFKLAWLRLSEPYLGSAEHLEKIKAESLKDLSKKRTDRDIFNEKAEEYAYGHHPWLGRIDSTAISAVDPDFVKDVYSRSFTDFKGLSVMICTDIDKAIVKDYVCRYVASLISDYPYRKGRFIPDDITVRGEGTFSEVRPPVSAPLCDVSCNFIRKLPTDRKTDIEVSVLDHIMSARYVDLIREKRGGTYHVSFSTGKAVDPRRTSVSTVEFQTRPELRELLIRDVREEMERMIQSGPGTEEMDNAVKYLLKHHTEYESKVDKSIRIKQSRMEFEVFWGKDYDYDYESVLRSIRPEDIRLLARKIYSGNRYFRIYTEQ